MANAAGKMLKKKSALELVKRQSSAMWTDHLHDGLHGDADYE